MSRSFSCSALTLRVKPSGESNREAWFLSAEEGLLRATVFGGPKSRLRSQVAPFHEGRLWIYHDPVRDSRKVSDFDVQSWRPGIRELYERAMAAGALAETILVSHGGGGNWPEAAKLAGSVLDALDGADAAACSALSVYFLWHWAGILGVRPDLSTCASCGRQVNINRMFWYSRRKEALFCDKCSPDQEVSFRVGPGAVRWLTGIESLPAPELAGVPADYSAESLEQARTLSQAVVAGALGKKLPTWEQT